MNQTFLAIFIDESFILPFKLKFHLRKKFRLNFVRSDLDSDPGFFKVASGSDFFGLGRRIRK